MAIQIQSLLAEVQAYKSDSTRDLDHAQLCQRVEHLEDVITELKTASSNAQTLVQLREVIARQAAELTDLSKRMRQLQQQKVQAASLFD